MRLRLDKESEALYFRLDETAILDSEEVQPGMILDFNVDGRVVGVEILNISPEYLPSNCKCYSLKPDDRLEV